jgi:anti-sigma factor RsiW
MIERNQAIHSASAAPHWTDEELLDHLYGLDPEDSERLRHLAQCEDCLHRAEQWHATRRQVTAAPEISGSFLAAQRAEIYRRIEERRPRSWFAPLAPAIATLALLVIAIFLYQPAPTPAPREVAITDSEFFSQVYDDVYRTEPKGLDTIHGLFEESQ